MALANNTDFVTPTVDGRLSSGEVVLVPAPGEGMVSLHRMVSHQLWLRGELGAMSVHERPTGWRGEAQWWLPDEDRHAGLRALLPDLMPWLPPALDAPRKLQVAERMPYPASPRGTEKWQRDDPTASRPFVDAVFVDDGGHLHLVDVVPAAGVDVLRILGAWHMDVQFRAPERHWLHRGTAAGTALEAEYAKLCWLRDRPPVADICSLLQSRGDEMPRKTAEAFWQRVGTRCFAYWHGNVPYEERESPHSILVTDGAMPADERLLARSSHDNQTLACVTPFVVDGCNWLRVDVRGWTEMRQPLSESALPATDRICRMAGATDVGKQREANQDAAAWREEEGWAAVADGMGGHPKGDVASATVLRVFGEAMEDWPDAKTPHPRRSVAQRLRRAAVRGNAALWDENKSVGIFKRMGTTLCALRLHGDRVSIVHAGDSRIYAFTPGTRYREPKLRQLTEDHGEGGGLDRALGMWEGIPFDIDTLPVDTATLYLLCTDGLTNMVRDEDILGLCIRHTRQDWDLAGLTVALIAAANEAGGRDNITVCVVEARERPSV